jgi:long-chain fatty acid transport protein
MLLVRAVSAPQSRHSGRATTRPRRADAARAIVVAAVLIGLPNAALAGGVEYLSNQGPDYLRTFSRNAATDGVDAASYHPSGTAFLAEGMHLGLGTQTLVGSYTIEHRDVVYRSDVFVPVLPSLHAVYRSGSLALFGAVTFPAGGGSLSYDDGIPYLIPLVVYVDDPDESTPSKGEFQGSSSFYGLTLGAAWRFADWVSVSLGGRATLARKRYDGHANYGSTLAELHTAKTALGACAIAGLTLRPGFGLTIGLRYEMKTPMTFTAETTTSNLLPMEKWEGTALESFRDGAEESRPMPAVFGAGVQWVGFGWQLSSSFQAYFNRAADDTPDYDGLPNSGGIGAFVKSWDDDYDNGWELSFAAEYDLTPALRLSAGYVRTISGGNADTLSDFEQALDSHSVGGGCRYGLTERLLLTVGLSRTFYTSASNKALAYPIDDAPETFSKAVYDLALGVQIRL